MTPLTIRPYKPEDAEAICTIYNHYIAHTVITFERDLMTPQQMHARITGYTRSYPWLVAEEVNDNSKEIIGYAYATKWRERIAYEHTCEASVYLSPAHTGKGYGKALYQDLIHRLSNTSTHVVLGCIALPNEASVKLHEGLGFTKVAQFNEVGFKFEQWLDVGYWQLTLKN